MSYSLSGNVTFFDRPAAVQAALGIPAVANQAGDSPVNADLQLPDTASLGVKHRMGNWDILGDVTWVGWSSLDALRIVRNNGSLLEETLFNWRDTWRFGLGVNYRPSGPWTFRFGVAYDQTPTNDTFRNPRVPDESRTWVALGAQYRISKDGAIDFGYAHLFFDDPKIDMSGPPVITPAQAAGRGALRGNYDAKVDIFSVQYRHTF
jgi:long-chain fatty acid transport protein